VLLFLVVSLAKTGQVQRHDMSHLVPFIAAVCCGTPRAVA